MIPESPTETFSADERRRLAPHFTSLDGPVFALTNLPDVVKAALFARYSRSPKSLRRLFLDEFLDPAAQAEGARAGSARADRLMERVFLEYGDDSVAQLAGVHLACEGVSNIATKLLERGRLMAYLEQSTRYIPFTDRPGGRWRYLTPEEIGCRPALRARFERAMDNCFQTYASLMEPLCAHLADTYPRQPGTPEAAHRRAIRARALDVLRGLLPAATCSNVGIFGSPQAYEALVLRLRACQLAEARGLAERILAELRKVVPAFTTRLDQPDRGGVWVDYLRATRSATSQTAARLLPRITEEPAPEVRLVDFDPDGEIKVIAAALYRDSRLGDERLTDLARGLGAEARAAVLRAYVGERANRRHRPGRAFERTSYRFDILTDYGAFRDLQRHRLLTIEWQTLSPEHGYGTPAEIEALDVAQRWRGAMEQAAEAHQAVAVEVGPHVASYAVPMAYRIRFALDLNAREAMHMIELRTSKQGHASYRRVCQEMHRLIAEHAGHRALAAAMRFVDRGGDGLERLEAEVRAENRRADGV
jgi:thymidylate synthase ThyX